VPITTIQWTSRPKQIKGGDVSFKRSLVGATLAVVALLLAAVVVAACGGEPNWATTETTLFPLQHSFMQELSDDGYSVAMFTQQEGGTKVLVVWVPVDPEKTTQAANDAIFDHVVALAEKYGAAEAAGGRLRVELFDPGPGGLVKDNIFESRDFDLSATVTSTVAKAATTRTSTIPSADSTTLAGSVPSTREFSVHQGVWDLRVDRRGGSEDADEAFKFLPEAGYQPIGDGPTYRVVIPAQGDWVFVTGTRGGTQFGTQGRRTSTTDGRVWYDLIDSFAGGRFVIWQDVDGLQAELTVYGSGRPIVFSERGSLVPNAVSLLDEEATAEAEVTLREFFRAWAAKDLVAWKALLSESRQKDMILGDWTFANLDHIEFGAAVAVPEAIDSYVTSGSGSRQGLDRGDVRCFRAPVTFYHEPGVVGPNESGEELPWLWWLARSAEGEWRVDSWGA
jgi:hypothetical protein